MKEDRRYFTFNEIHVIESLDKEEIQTGEVLYNDLLRYIPLKVKPVKCILHKVNCKSDFVSVFKRLNEDVISFSMHPLLHFEIHGSKDGIVLNSKELIPWRQMAELFREVNIKTRNNTLVSLATCYGSHIYKSILPSLPAPFFAIIAPWDTVTTNEAMVSFTRFFECILLVDNLKQIDINLALERLNENNTSSEKFGFFLSEIIFDRIAAVIDNKLKDPVEFERGVESMVEDGLKIESIRMQCTRKQLRELCIRYLNNPGVIRQGLKKRFLMRDSK